MFLLVWPNNFAGHFDQKLYFCLYEMKLGILGAAVITADSLATDSYVADVRDISNFPVPEAL